MSVQYHIVRQPVIHENALINHPLINESSIAPRPDTQRMLITRSEVIVIISNTQI